jgi:DNA-binding transcriptional MerR regulator
MTTIKEIAELRGVTEHTVRRWIAECDLDPDGYKKNDRGSDSPLYSLEKLDAAMSGFRDKKLISQLSADTQRTVAYGFIERYGTPEEKAALRAYIDQQDRLLEYKDKVIEEQLEDIKLISASLACAEDKINETENEVWEARNEYNKLLRLTPDKYKSKEQRDWDRATSSSSLRWMFEGRK